MWTHTASPTHHRPASHFHIPAPERVVFLGPPTCHSLCIWKRLRLLHVAREASSSGYPPSGAACALTRSTELPRVPRLNPGFEYVPRWAGVPGLTRNRSTSGDTRVGPLLEVHMTWPPGRGAGRGTGLPLQEGCKARVCPPWSLAVCGGAGGMGGPSCL